MKQSLRMVLTLLFCLLAAPLRAAPVVDVNTADRAQLESVRGIGPHMAEVILKERTRGGAFASAEDFADRVPGIGPKRAEKLRAAGLRVGAATSARRARSAERAGTGAAPSLPAGVGETPSATVAPAHP